MPSRPRPRTRLTASNCGRFAVAVLVALFVQVSPYPAHACIVGSPFTEQTIDDAETVIRGRVVAYEIVSNELGVFAKLEFDVLETYRGQDSPAYVALWNNSTFSFPETLADFTTAFGQDIVAGLGPMDVSEARPGMLLAIRLYSPEWLEFPWVLQSLCEPPFMGEFSRFEPLLRRRGVLE